jgi:hypothetical protein
MIGIFPDHGLQWRHFRSDGTTSGAQETRPGHAAQVTWILADEGPEDLYSHAGRREPEPYAGARPDC